MEIDVLIVGAGPVGLFLANECARRGLTYRIIEAHAAQSQHSKALAIFPRTLEIFDMAGRAQPFLEAANRVTGISFISRQHTLGRIDFRPSETPYQYVAMVSQDVTERLLLQSLRNRAGNVEYQTSLVSASQSADAVEAVVECNGSQQTIHAKYLVGCDGAHSVVRHIINLTFDGGEYADSFMLADILTNDALPADEMQLCPNDDGPLAIFPMSATRRRLVGTVDEVEDDAPTLDLVNRLLASRAPAGIKATSLVWSSYFHIHHRYVSRMQQGRMFVAGDAAHIHSPFGGQGMNTGLQDAWNLAWKLELSSRGLAKDVLLESYTAERHPIVKGVIETTHVLTTALGARNKIAQGIRDAAIPIVTRIPQFTHLFVERLSGLANAYKGSPIVRGSGERYFDESLRDGNIGRRYLLFTNAADQPAYSRLDALQKQFEGSLEIRRNGVTGIRLIRPDGYTAYNAASASDSDVSALREILQIQLR